MVCNSKVLDCIHVHILYTCIHTDTYEHAHVQYIVEALHEHVKHDCEVLCVLRSIRKHLCLFSLTYKGIMNQSCCIYTCTL